MLSFFQHKNAEAVVIKFLKYSGIITDPQLIIDELDKHPNYPSLLAISDVLTNFNIENSAFRCSLEELQQLPTPFIVHGRSDGGNFMIVHEIDSELVIVSSEKWDKRKLKPEEFSRQYNGVALIAEATKSISSSKKIYGLRIPVIVISILALLGLLVLSNSWIISSLTWQPVMIAVTKTVGLLVSALLLVQALDKNNPLIQVLCTAGGKKSDCKAILSSKAAQAFWGYSWSEIGFFYFAGTWLVSLFGGGSSVMLKTLLILNAISLPYTFYSIYYQARVAKQWCTLCCTIQALLWIEFIPLLNINLPLTADFSIQPKDLSTLVVCLVSPIVLWAIFKPLFITLKQVPPLKDQLREFKYNAELFQLMLTNQPKYALPGEDWSVVLGNAEADHVLTMVSNPYCPPCAKTHALLEELLEQNSNVQARIVFSTPDREDDKVTLVARHMVALNQQSDKTLLKHALNDWYAEKQKNFETWTKKYPTELKDDDFKKLSKQREWCKMADVKGTPTLLLNGNLLPEVYRLPDLKYMLQ